MVRPPRPDQGRTGEPDGSQPDDDERGVVVGAALRVGDEIGEHGVGEGLGPEQMMMFDAVGEAVQAGVDVLAPALDRVVGVGARVLPGS